MNPHPFWILLATVDSPDGPPDFRGTDLDPERLARVITLARANGLYYPFLKRYLAAGGRVPSNETSRWGSVYRAIGGLRSSLDALAEASRVTGIEYLVIKNVQTIEHVPRDLDIFLREADRAAFLEGLRSAGFEFAYNDGSEISLARPGSMRVDVYSRIHYLARDFLDESYLFRSRAATRLHGHEVPGLEPEAAFLLNSAHAIFGHGAITLLDFLDFRNLQALSGVPNQFRDRAASFDWAGVYDLWWQRLADLQVRVFEQRIPTEFPQPLEGRFVLEAVSRLNGHVLGLRERAALRLSLLWDRLLFAAEASGVEEGLRSSALARSLANSAGHRIRFMRGDRKSTLRALKRVREET
jgi:Uncharacterised nucleotidyltransferase